MKLLLVNPPLLYAIRPGIPAQVERGLFSYVPLGLLYLAASVLKHPEHQAEIFDAQAPGFSLVRFREKIKRTTPDIVGIYTGTFHLLDALCIARTAKEDDPRIRVCLGGPHVSIYPMETIALPEVDFAVAGEGEETLIELLDAMSGTGGFSCIKGLLFKQEGRLVRNAPREPAQDLDAVAFPARHVAGQGAYGNILSGRRQATAIITSRGCSYRCTFCSRQHLGNTTRKRSVPNVLEEIRECLRQGRSEFIFADENFAFDRGRVYAFCEAVLREGLDFSWQIKARIDALDAELLKLLKRAGCLRIHYGVESGSDRILGILKKGITTGQVRETVALTKRSGIKTLLYFMLGAPSETRDEALRTIRFAVSLKPDYAYFSILTPFPGTELYEAGLAQGAFTDFWKDFVMQPSAQFRLQLWTDHMRDDELGSLLKYAYRRFYLRPAQILKHARILLDPAGARDRLRLGLQAFGYITDRNHLSV